MKRAGVLLCVFIFLASARIVSAQTPSVSPSPSGVSKQDVKVTANVGEFYLTVTGIIAPYASLSLISDGNVYKAAAADPKGNFSFSRILINRGFSHFCIQAVDLKRIGESYTCFTFPPATNDITMQNIFLPPTLGLNHREIREGSDVVLFGYSMPGAEVKVTVTDDREVLAASDSTGYYEYTLKEVKRGSYELVAGATFEGKQSLLPSRAIVLKVVAFADLVIDSVRNAFNWLKEAAPYLGLILLILIVIFTIWREKILIFLHLKPKKLHHAWFMGY